MGKKNKKTRWRTLTLNGHQSDSEDSSTKSSVQTSKSYQHKYSKFPYSSQSTPIRKFQHDSSKSTRSNSTTSEHKTTFNEDEYTRITTPRQDVLFKKGYLNKPKTYQTQTSTGTSSTANSTSTCTPDHQSADGTEGTDLEYESQFVFPNGFIDHNGIYYINSFEPFPLVVYNAPICYPEYTNSRSKRYSTDSLAESVSPHNEEINQEPPQNGISECMINNTPVFTQSYMQPSGYYYNNGVSSLTNGQYVTEETRRIKKKRRRKISRAKSSNTDDLTSEESDSYDSCDEVFGQSEYKKYSKKPNCPLPTNHQVSEKSIQSEEVTQSVSPKTIELNSTQNTDGDDNNLRINQENHITSEISNESRVDDSTVKEEVIHHTENEQIHIEPSKEEQTEDQSKPSLNDAQNLLLQSLLKSSEKKSESNNPDIIDKPNSISDPPKDCITINDELQESSLKPDAEEFIPRTLRQLEPLPFDPNVQFLNVPPNFIPIPFINHVGEMQRPPPFLPPGMPINFILPQDSKILPSNFVNLVPNSNFVPKTNVNECATEVTNSIKPSKEAEEKQKDVEQNENCPLENETQLVQVKKSLKTDIDIARIVSKLEEAAKQQRHNEVRRQTYNNKNGHRYNNISKFYNNPNSRVRFLNHNYQASRSNNIEHSYERKYKRSEQRSKPKVNIAHEDKLNNEKLEKPVEPIEEKQQQVDLSIEESVTKPEEKNEQESKQEMQDHVNNVNIRLNDNCSIINKDLKLENNYSETLKKKVDAAQQKDLKSSKPKYPRYEKHKLEKTEKRSKEKPIVIQTPTSKPQKPQNQWISVSNRKKRKNKNNEEQNSIDEQDEQANDDHLYETFDVSLLVDVVPPSKTDEDNQETIKETHANKDEYSNVVTAIQKDEPAVLLEVKEETVMITAPQIKEKFISKPKNKNEDKKRKAKKKSQIKRVIITDINMETEKSVSLDQNKDSIEQNDVPVECTHEEPNILKNESTEDLKPVLEEVLESKMDTLPIVENTVNTSVEEATPIVETITEIPEKKNKKKKKKLSLKQSLPSIAKVQSTSSSNTTLNNLDDSCDFLLENSVLDDLDHKTNIEISQELDRIIQKSLYGNLEEKIRALEISDLDKGFFKTINFSYPEKPNNLINASDFGKILKNTTHLLKMPKSKEEIDQENLINIDFSKIKLPDLEPQPSTSKAGIFLENPEVIKIVDELDQDHTRPFQEKSKSRTKRNLKNKIKQTQVTTKDAQEQLIIEKGETQNASIEQDTKNLTTTSNTFSSQPKQEMLYPITQAVKEWMNKTRENTPDVELLKSPNTIYKEFCEKDTETESESSEDKKSECKDLPPIKEPLPLPNLSEENNHVPTKIKKTFNTDDEITIWSLSPQNSIEEDLIDCWENEEDLKPNHVKHGVIIPNGEIKEIKGSVANPHAQFNGHVEKGEEAIEVYESKYGKNEDFLKIKAEIDEQRRNINFPRHGDLPYRAICCSIM